MTQDLSAILSACAGPVAVFTDFDGTLAPIAPTPDAVEVPPYLPRQIVALTSALSGAFAVITGRPISEIDGFLAIPEMTVAGSHGGERRDRDGFENFTRAIQPRIDAIAQALESLLGDDARLLIETKHGAVAAHYRAAPDKAAAVHEAMQAAVAGDPRIEIIKGKMVVEARMAGANKGEAVRALMAKAPFSGRKPLFIGDDVTDEDGFRVVEALGGIGVKIGAGETAARYRLPDIEAAHALLDALVEREHRHGKSARVGADANRIEGGMTQ